MRGLFHSLFVPGTFINANWYKLVQEVSSCLYLTGIKDVGMY